MGGKSNLKNNHMMKQKKMSFYRILLVFLLIFEIFHSCRSVDVCDAVRCRREGSGGKIRPGHRPLKFGEMPYLAIILNEKRPVCFGVVISSKHILTTCTCGMLENNYDIGVGSEKFDFDLTKLRIFPRILTEYHRKCDTNFGDLFNPNDFATVKIRGQARFPISEYAYFKSTDSLSVNENYVNSLLERNENDCFGVGFGGYSFFGKPPIVEGTQGKVVNLYDYRLIPDNDCNRFTPGCCGKWSALGLKRSIQQTGLHCALRNRERSLCYGNLASPIVCDGYVIGFLKGHLKCSPDDKSYAGPDLFVSIGEGVAMANRDRQLTRMFSANRPKPEALADSIQDFGPEGSPPSLDSLAGKNKTNGNATKSNRGTEDYYYDVAPKFFEESLFALITSTMLNFILFI